MSTISRTKRCAICSRKTGLDFFTCKCNPSLLFCEDHRFGWKHECTLNVKAFQQQALEKQLKSTEGKSSNVYQEYSNSY